MTIRQFEDIEAWQRARELAGLVYRVTRQGEFARDFGLRDQLRRAAVSVMANIAEGFGRRSNRDFCHFLYLSKGSAVEVLSHLYVALDQDYVDAEQFSSLRQGYLDVQSMLVKFIQYLESTQLHDYPRESS